MDANSGEPWSKNISDLSNEIAHGRTMVRKLMVSSAIPMQVKATAPRCSMRVTTTSRRARPRWLFAPHSHLFPDYERSHQ